MSNRDRIQTIPTNVPRVQIIYDFITPQEETFLLEHINQVGGGSLFESNKDQRKNWGWKTLNGRRSMYWGGTILPNSHHLIPTPFPKFMDGSWPDILDRIAQTGVYDQWTVTQGKEKGKGKDRGPNHCLVNEYLPSQGILPHTDGPAYQPCTTTLSLSSHTILSLRSNPLSLSTSTSTSSEEIDKIEIFLPPRSLLILSSTLYSTYLHGIQTLAVSPIDSLKRCVNWESWWEHLIQGGGDREKFEAIFRNQDEGEDHQEKKEQEEEEDRKRKEAFGELKKGLKELNLLSESTELETGSSTLTIRDQVARSEDETASVAKEGGATDWENLVKTQRRKIENSEGVEFVNGWKRGKRVSLTCRRNAGKVKDLGGLLSRVGGKK
ncbi:hypothetical protein JCM3765_006077 [Sporobolomyces pararoseus]